MGVLAKACLASDCSSRSEAGAKVSLGLGSPASPALPFFGWEGSSTKIDRKKVGTLILTSLLLGFHQVFRRKVKVA